MRALNTIGPRRPRIAFATSRKGPQAHLLAYTPPRETQPVFWQGIPVGGTAREVWVLGKDGQLTASASPATPTAALHADQPSLSAVDQPACSAPGSNSRSSIQPALKHGKTSS